MTEKKSEFKEIAHCGGVFTVSVKTDESGRKSYQLGVSHSNPTPASFVGIYALERGIPVGMINLAVGIGRPFNPPPYPGCLTVFLSSDIEGKFGHQCPRCKGYWRSDGPSALRKMCCAYCGVEGDGSHFLTEAQKKYVETCTHAILEALATIDNGEAKVSMDEEADKVLKNHKAPSFYYKEQEQQNRFKCISCTAFNDVLGRYAYCSSCGKFNALEEFKKDIEKIKSNFKGGDYEASLKDLISSFDSAARSFIRNFIESVPMTPRRKNEWERKKFHNIEKATKDLNDVFDINLMSGVSSGEKGRAIRFFARRHVYEHNGGEIDQKYIDDTGDVSVKIRQKIHETKESVLEAIELLEKLLKNFDEGYLLISPLITDEGN